MKRLRIGVLMALASIAPAAAQQRKDSSGTVVQSTAMAGSLGVDFSANPPSLPNVGANFGGAGPYANYALVATAPANPARISIDVENTSGAQIALVLDDGLSAAASAAGNATVFALAGGSGPGAQGGSWVSLVEKGRVQVYAPTSSAQVAIRQN